MNLLVTGGAGFIGSNFIRHILKKYPDYRVVNYDKLTYAGNLDSLRDVEPHPNYKFVKGDIIDKPRIREVIETNKVTHIVNFAAESHVDRSIEGPNEFVMTNVVGTQVLLDAALEFKIKHFHHVSTDEVYGELPLKSKEKFKEETAYDPRSPYSASKAGSDHLVKAYYETYRLPITISNCSNNFGPFQDPEKFLPRAITNLLTGKKIPIYGDGKYVRDWLHVKDHCRAVDLILHKGRVGKTYIVGGLTQDISNLDVARKLLKLFGKNKDFIEFVKDRPGHDRRYAVDWSMIKKELNWSPLYDFDTWLEKTVDWYRDNSWWWKHQKKKSERFYKRVFERQEAEKFTDFIKETSIPGLLIVEMPTYKDERGFFREVGRFNALEKVTGVKFKVKQWNHSKSEPRTIRGIHAENWNKLVYPVTGKVFSAIVDIREDSPTFGKVETFEFKENDKRALFIPKGLANSSCVVGSRPVHYLYLVDAYYDGKDTRAIAWDDPDLAIKWPVRKPAISKRDKNNPRLRELFPDKF